MLDDRLITSRATQPSTSGQSAGTVAGNRGTGAVTYYFRLKVTPALRQIHEQDRILFHRDIVRILFGPDVKNTRFMREERYRAVNWSKADIPLEGDTFSFWLSNRLIDQIGRIPVIAPERIMDAAGQEIEDLQGHGGQIALASKVQAGLKDVKQILLSGIGFDPGDLRTWNTLPIYDRLSTLDDVTAIVDLLGDLDDAAYAELLRSLKPVQRGYTKWPRRVNPDKVHAFRQRLEALRDSAEARDRKAQLAGFDAALGSASLDGCDTLYFKIEELKREPYSYSGGGEIISGRSTAPTRSETPRRLALQAEIDDIRRAKGFKSGTLDTLIKGFEKSFEKRAAVFARRTLARHLRFFEYHVARTDSHAMVHAIRQHGGALLGSIFDAASMRSTDGIKAALARSQEQYGTLIAQFPLMQYANFWTLLAKSQEGLKGDFSVVHFKVLVEETRRSIHTMLKRLENANYVWKGDLLVNGALVSFGMYADPKKARGHNAMLTHIVARKMKDEQKKGVLTNVLLAVAALALSLTGVGLLVAAGVALSLVDVYLMIGDRAEIQRQNLSAFSSRSPPSDFWILLAIAGAAADVGGLVKLLSAGKIVAVTDSVAALDNLLIKANIKSEKARRAAHKLRVIKVELEKAKRGLREVAMSLLTIGGGMDAGATLVYHLARLGLTEFRHFLLELSHAKLLGKIPDTADYNAIRNALKPDDVKQLKAMHRRGVSLARADVAMLDEVIDAADDVGRELNAAKRQATEIWSKRSAPGISRKLENTRSPYNTLRDQHHAAMRNRERLALKQRALMAQMKLLLPAADRTATSWGFFAEDWVRLTPLKGQKPWPEMASQSVEAVDSIRKGADGMPELMQSKAIVDPLESAIVDKIKGKIRQAQGNFNSNKYKDLARNFNESRFPMSKNHYKFDLKTNWRDKEMRIYLEIPIITGTPMDIEAARAAVEVLFRSNFPPNAVLRIRTVTPEEIAEVLSKGAP